MGRVIALLSTPSWILWPSENRFRCGIPRLASTLYLVLSCLYNICVLYIISLEYSDGFFLFYELFRLLYHEMESLLIYKELNTIRQFPVSLAQYVHKREKADRVGQ